MSSVGRVSLDLGINQKGFNKQVNSIGSQTSKAFNSMSVAVGNIIANMAQKAIASIGVFVKDSIAKGSELAELQNVVDSVFTTMSDRVNSFSKTALEQFGLTEKQAKKMVGTFGAMSKSFGYSESQAYGMSTALASLAGDVASFYNLNHDEAYTKLKSVFTGETESLKELGVVMTQSALDEFALAKGFGKTTNQMSEQEKVALRLAFVQDKLKTASGDFLRTQDQWANQTRILTGQFESFKATIGQGLINVLTPVVKVLNTIMSKLIQVANAFKSFTEMIMGVKNDNNSAKAMAGVAEAAELAANSTGDIEDAANGAASAAKKAQKSLMGFDEINRLSSKGSEGAASTSGVSFDNIEFGEAVNKQDKIANESMSKLKDKVQELIALFRLGFKEGLGSDFEASIKRIKDHVEGIKSGIINIFTDPKVTSSVNTWAQNIFHALSNVLGSITSYGASIGEALIGGIDLFLKQNGDFISSRMAGIFDALSENAKIIGDVSVALASIFEVFRGPEAKQIIADFIGIFTSISLGVTELAIKIGNDIINCIAQPIIDNKDKIAEAIQNSLEPVSEVLSTLNDSVKTTFEDIEAVYKKHIKPMFKGFADGFSSIIGTILDAYNKYIAPVLDKFASKFSEVWTSTIQPVLSKILNVIGKLCNLISVLWSNYLVPLINWIVDTIVPVIAPIIEAVGALLFSTFQTITEIIEGIMDTLGGLIDFITGVFTGDWGLAWEGIKGIFIGIWNKIKAVFTGIWEIMKATVRSALSAIKGTIELVFTAIKGIVQAVWNAIAGIFSSAINGLLSIVSTGFSAIRTVVSTIMGAISSVISGIANVIAGIINGIFAGIEFLVNGVVSAINLIIRAMNRLSFDVPDWVPGIGGETFGFNVKEMSEASLPRLAEGGYVRANQPQTVVVGDNKRQGEIISPEGKMLDVVIQALEQFFSRLKDVGYSNSNNNDIGDIIIPIYLDGSAFDEVIVTAQQRRSMRSGGR